MYITDINNHLITEYNSECTRKNVPSNIQLFNFEEIESNVSSQNETNENLLMNFFENCRRFIKRLFSPKENEAEWDKNYNWSEGISRNISEIVINSYVAEDKELVEVLEKIGEKEGFKVSTSKLGLGKGIAMWIEDYGIRRADGKIYIQPPMYNNVESIAFKQNPIRNSFLSEEYSFLYDEAKLVYGKSYLEGGNVLNTRLKNSEAGAIVGLESINYTIEAMKLKGELSDFDIAKTQIAKDLGIKEDNLTFIQQPDFHIDMYYRPLQDGIIAAPDFESAIEILKTTQVTNLDDKAKEQLINDLTKTAEFFANKNFEKTLINKGYTIKKIPCFSPPSHINKTSIINFNNAICGTGKNKNSFIITNESNYPELNEIIKKSFQDAGVDSVYFVPTNKYLQFDGGIDCLTQER